MHISRHDASTTTTDAARTPPDARKRLILMLGAIQVLLVVVILLRGLLTPVATSTPGGSSADATPGPAAPLAGHYMPDATIRDLNDKLVALSSYRGHIVVFNFWYAACPPCLIEMPALENVYLTYEKQGVIVVGIDMVDTTG
ncbi:MAG TPA: TlpA disulfide reductase family protein, partial [Ktedonobacterales bacterium]|nr:TlpA disulfide reductase family protein [Ktedonobacterales bacterium]